MRRSCLRILTGLRISGRRVSEKIRRAATKARARMLSSSVLGLGLRRDGRCAGKALQEFDAGGDGAGGDDGDRADGVAGAVGGEGGEGGGGFGIGLGEGWSGGRGSPGGCHG